MCVFGRECQCVVEFVGTNCYIGLFFKFVQRCFLFSVLNECHLGLSGLRIFVVRNDCYN